MITFLPDSRRHFSVYEKDKNQTYSNLGRVGMTYDKVVNGRYCACCTGISCIHKYISKWALVMGEPGCFEDSTDIATMRKREMDLIQVKTRIILTRK